MGDFRGEMEPEPLLPEFGRGILCVGFRWRMVQQVVQREIRFRV